MLRVYIISLILFYTVVRCLFVYIPKDLVHGWIDCSTIFTEVCKWYEGDSWLLCDGKWRGAGGGCIIGTVCIVINTKIENSNNLAVSEILCYKYIFFFLATLFKLKFLFWNSFIQIGTLKHDFYILCPWRWDYKTVDYWTIKIADRIWGFALVEHSNSVWLIMT